jgi:hypothetical protein
VNEELREFAGCPDEEFHVSGYSEDPTARYAYAAWVYHCAGDEHVLVLRPRLEAPVELGRFQRDGAVLSTEFSEIEAGRPVLIAIISGEPDGMTGVTTEPFDLELDDLRDGKRILSASSPATRVPEPRRR